MKISIITAFPNSFAPLKESIVKRAGEKNLLELNILNLRDFASDERKTIDDRPFGGGAGMLLQIEPIYKALKSLNIYPTRDEKTKVVLMSVKGKTWNQSMASDHSKLGHLVIICGHYEGVDNRVVENLIDSEISIGNFILSGGELAAMVVTDSIVRLIDGVLGNNESAVTETSFFNGGKRSEHPQYTRPEVFKTEEGEEWSVPKVLLSGNHGEIEKWKEENSKETSN